MDKTIRKYLYEFNISSFHWKKDSTKIPSSHSKNWVPKKLLIIYCFVNAILEKVIKTELFSNCETCRKKKWKCNTSTYAGEVLAYRRQPSEFMTAFCICCCWVVVNWNHNSKIVQTFFYHSVLNFLSPPIYS